MMTKARRKRLMGPFSNPIGLRQVRAWLADAISEQRGRCHYCKGTMIKSDVPEERRFRPTIDHYIPLSKGGMHIRSNIVAACKRCNDEKGSMMPETYEALWKVRHKRLKRGLPISYRGSTEEIISVDQADAS